MRLLLTGLLLLASSVDAQSLVVASASPADYAAGVPTETTLSFTFSEPLGDVTQGFGSAPVLVALPTEAVEIGEITQSEDGATVSFAVSLQPDERYVFLVLDAVSADGDRLARPFALNLTTRSSAGSLRFSGDLADSEGASLEGALVALVTGDFDTGAVEFVGVDVIEGAGSVESYSVGPVPFGLYTVGAVRLPFPDPDALAFGFYDPNQDGVPDVLLSQTGNDVALAPPAPISADEQVEDAQATAASAITNPRLIGIAQSRVDEDGRARSWRYRFEGDAEHVEVVQLGLFSLPIPSIEDQFGFAPLPLPFRDSDDALGIAEADGGAAFRTEQEGLGRTVSVAMSADPFVPGTREAEWRIEYVSRADPNGDPAATATFTVPMLTVTASEPGPTGTLDLRVLGNPSRGSLRLAVRLANPESAEIRLVDVRGRTVAQLYRGLLGAGETILVRPLPALAPGVYAVQVSTAQGQRMVPISVLR